MFVSANYLRTIGVTLAPGPGFDAAVDDPLTADPAVILGYAFWQNHMGSDPDIVGKTLTLDGIPHVVVGVAVRVALCASRRRVLRMILFDVVKLVTPGVAVGLVITAALVRLSGEKAGIPLSNVEPLAYVVGAAIATLVAVLASLVPARRAASVQPIVAMRSI
jgi:FtsX-like permease family/MacB-like periplasmic core domain